MLGGSLLQVLSPAPWSLISNSFAVQECSCRGPVTQGWRKLLVVPPPGQRSPVSQPPPPSYRWWCTAEGWRKGLSFKPRTDLYSCNHCYKTICKGLVKYDWYSYFSYRDVSGLQQQSRDMSGRQSFSYGSSNLRHQLRTEGLTRCHLEKQNNSLFSVCVVLRNAETVWHFLERLHYREESRGEGRLEDKGTKQKWAEQIRGKERRRGERWRELREQRLEEQRREEEKMFCKSSRKWAITEKTVPPLTTSKLRTETVHSCCQ